MRNIFLLSVLLLLLSSCVTQKRCNRKFPPQIWERTTIETIQKPYFITLRVPPVTIAGGTDIIINEDGTFTSDASRLETEFAFSVAWVQDNRLFHELNQKEVNITDTVHVTDTIVVTEKGEVREVNVLKWWQKWLIYLGVVFLLFCLFLLGRLANKII